MDKMKLLSLRNLKEINKLLNEGWNFYCNIGDKHIMLSKPRQQNRMLANNTYGEVPVRDILAEFTEAIGE